MFKKVTVAQKLYRIHKVKGNYRISLIKIRGMLHKKVLRDVDITKLSDDLIYACNLIAVPYEDDLAIISTDDFAEIKEDEDG